MDKKQQIITALYAFARQRSGIEFRNYGDVASFRAEQRSITKDLQHARTLIRAVELRDSITADDIIAASKGAYSGRLTIHACDHGDAHKVTCGANHKHIWCEACDPAPSAQCHWCNGRGYSHAKPGAVAIDYCTGQYFPTEYRRAVCAVMASALWDWKRTKCMPAPDARADHDIQAPDTYGGKSAGQWLRDSFKREYGRGIASRWFD